MSICLIPISNTEPVSVNTSHGQTTKYWGTQIILWPHHFLPELEHSSLFWARVSAFAYMYVTTNIHTGLKLPLNAAGLWMRHEDLLEWRACTTHSALRSVSLAASALNHLSCRTTSSSVSTLFCCPPIPFSGPKPAAQEWVLLPLHLEQSTQLQSKIVTCKSITPDNREG